MTIGADNQRVIRMGVIGIGGGATGMVPVFAQHPGFKWTAAADIDRGILDAFNSDYGVETYTDAEAMCKSPNVDAVYVATPNRWHKDHALFALENGKHVLCEKPMTITMEDAETMVKAADRNSVHLAVNVKHSFELRVLKLREMVRSGQYGQLRMINYWFYNDWLYRPRTPEELTPEWGGGVPWRQGPHQIDIIRTVAGGLVRSVRGMAGAWNPARRVPGTHAAFLDFEEGAVATAVYSGNDHFSTVPLVRGMGERGPIVKDERYAQARKEFKNNPEAETAAAAGERYGGQRLVVRAERAAGDRNTGGWMSGGPMIVSFDEADVWVQQDGLLVFGNEKQEEIPLPAAHGDGRWGRVNTFYESLIRDEPPPADGRWGMATLEVILSILQSSEERKEVFLKHQTPTADAGLAPAMALAEV
jgi:phthalate 4,5-cis-dihydrodiol dehydrogenase